MAIIKLTKLRIVVLGGVNKQGKKNPTELQGYYLGFEKRKDKFNPDKPKNLYKFKTPEGTVGVYGSAGVNEVMQSEDTVLNAWTTLIATGKTLDTGKGNPMKLFEAEQNTSKILKAYETPAPIQADEGESEVEGDDEYNDDSDVQAAQEEAVTQTTFNTNAEKQARIQQRLKDSGR